MKNKMIYCQLLLAAAFVLVGSAPVWPTFQYNNQRTGKCPYTGPDSTPTLLWSFDAEGEISLFASPVIGSDGTIYFCCMADGCLYAINPNGTLKWKYQTGGSLEGMTPAIGSNGQIAIAATDSCIYLLEDSVTYCRLRWKYNTHSSTPIYYVPMTIGVDGTVYGANGLLWAIGPNGNLKWTYNVAVSPSAAIAISADGSTIYTQHLVDGSPFIAYVSSVDTSGTENWKTVLGSAPFSLTQSAFSVGSDGSIYVPEGMGHLFAFSPSGSIRWQTGVLGVIYIGTSPAIGLDDTLYQPESNGWFFKVSPSNGAVAWADSNDLYIYSSPIIDDQNTFYQSYLCQNSDSVYYCILHAFSQNGQIKWSYQFEDSVYDISTPAMDTNGVIYVTGGNSLYAIGLPFDVREHGGNMIPDPVRLDVYPNPFHSQTAIRFCCTGITDNVKMAVYSTAGRLVKTIKPVLNNNEASAYWSGDDNNGNKVCAGVYFVRVASTGVKKTEKVILMK